MGKDTQKSFLDKWISLTKPESILHIKSDVDEALFNCASAKCIYANKDALPSEKFDLIIFDTPYLDSWNDESSGITTRDISGEKLEIRIHWENLLNTLHLLSPNGNCLFISDESDFLFQSGFERALNNNGFYTNALFNTGRSMDFWINHPLKNDDFSFYPTIAHITQKHGDELYTDILKNQEIAISSIDMYFNDKNRKDLTRYIDRKYFSGFGHISALQELELIEVPYKHDSHLSLKALSDAINVVSNESQDCLNDYENSLYVSSNFVGNSLVNTKPPDNYYKPCIQFILKKETIIDQFVLEFFNSEYGKLVLQSAMPNWKLPIEKIQHSFENIMIPIPPLQDQKFIVSTRKQLDTLATEIKNFNSLFSLNPNEGKKFHDQLSDMLRVIDKLTQPDKVRQIIKKGETKTSEFKQTMSLCIKKRTKEDYIQVAALKTVVAFLNTDGGDLIIGVDDDKNIIGINVEVELLYKNSVDKYLLHWKNLIKENIGEEFYPFIDPKIVEIESKILLHVECKSSKRPCFLKKSEFYVRTNPATDKLEGQTLIDYIQNHTNFQQNK